MNEPAEGGYEGLTQCELNRNMFVDARFTELMGSAGSFRWAPDRVVLNWAPLPGEADWDGEYGKDLRIMIGSGGPPLGPFLRGSSEALSFALTILYALQHLNQDDVWTKKDTLTVHVCPSFQCAQTRG